MVCLHPTWNSHHRIARRDVELVGFVDSGLTGVHMPLLNSGAVSRNSSLLIVDRQLLVGLSATLVFATDGRAVRRTRTLDDAPACTGLAGVAARIRRDADDKSRNSVGSSTPNLEHCELSISQVVLFILLGSPGGGGGGGAALWDHRNSVQRGSAFANSQAPPAPWLLSLCRKSRYPPPVDCQKVLTGTSIVSHRH